MAKGCPTLGCGGDPRYAAPGRDHIPGCHYPVGSYGIQATDRIPKSVFENKGLLPNEILNNLDIAGSSSEGADRPNA